MPCVFFWFTQESETSYAGLSTPKAVTEELIVVKNISVLYYTVPRVRTASPVFTPRRSPLQLQLGIWKWWHFNSAENCPAEKVVEFYSNLF